MGLAWMRLRERNVDAVEALLGRALPLARGAGDRRMEATILGSLGVVPKERGDFAGAYSHFQAALELHQQTGNRRFEGVAYTRLALLDLEHGQTEEVRRTAARALAIHRAFESRYTEGLSLTALGAAEHAEGHIDEARQVYAQAIPLHVTMGELRVHGCCVGYLGVADFEAGDVEPSVARLEEAIAILERAGEHRHAALFLAFRAAIDASLGRMGSAGSALERARGLLALHPHPRFAAVVELAEGAVNVAAGKHAAARGEPVGDDTASRARDRLRRVRSGDGGDPPASLSVNVRIAARLLERELAALAASGPAPAGALIVHPRGSWFVPPGGDRVDCRKRHALRRLMLKLTRQRIDRPGLALDPGTLVASGWPDERMNAESAQNRLHVTLNRLRNLGLRDLLLAADGGYLLDPARPVRLTDADD